VGNYSQGVSVNQAAQESNIADYLIAVAYQLNYHILQSSRNEQPTDLKTQVRRAGSRVEDENLAPHVVLLAGYKLMRTPQLHSHLRNLGT
jgi:hypothetical protein